MKNIPIIPIIEFAALLALAGTGVAQGSDPLRITCPPNRTNWICGGSVAFVNYPPPTTAGSCPTSATVTCSPPPTGAFILGTTTVNCRATNACRESATCSFTVTVRPPLLYGGLCHSPLGLAALNVNTNDELEISGLGTTGQDGVRIDLGESQGLRWSMKLPSSQDVDGRDFLVWQRQIGSSTAGSEILISEMAYASRNGRRTITPSAASYDFKLLLRGQVVFQQSGRTGEVEIPECQHVEQEHCVGQGFEGLNPNLPYCINFLTVECDWDTPSGPVRADALVVTPEDPLPPFTAIASIEILGRDLSVLTLHSERLLMFGSRTQASLPHLALGQARLVAENRTLMLADLGSSGRDGVRIELGERQGLHWRMDDPPGAPEGDLEIEVFGRTAAGTEVPLRRISHHYRSGRTSVTPGTGPYEFKLLLGGRVVFQQGGRTGDVDIPECHHVENEHCVGDPFADWHPGLLPYCFNFLTIECDWETPAGVVRADTLVLTPEDPMPSVTALSAVQILGRNVRGLPVLKLHEERLLTFGGSELRLACPPSLTVRTCSTNPVPVSFPPPVVSGDCSGTVTVICAPPSGSQFPAGTTTVNCTATDRCGNRSECRFTVTVEHGLMILSELEPNNALAGAHDLGMVSFVSVVGRVSPAGDVDYYRFTAVPNSTAWILVDTGGRKWAGANSRDSVLTLRNAGGDLIETDDNDGSGNGANSMLESGDASAIAGATLTGGTYYVSVSSIRGGIIAPYRLYLTVTTNNAATESEPNNSFDQPNTIVIPASPIGVRLASLALNDEDWYAIRLAEPSLLHLSVDGDPERDGTGTNTRLDLFRRDGASLLFTADSSGAGEAVAEGFVYRLSLPGTYYLRVRSASLPPTPGTYRVMVAHCPLPAPPAPGIVHRDGILTLSWPVALEPCVLRSSRDLRTWSFRNLTPLMEGNQLRVELPPDSPHDFFQLIPAGGFNNAVTACCDANGCRLPSSSDEECIGQIYWCYETQNSSVCEPLGPPHPDADD